MFSWTLTGYIIAVCLVIGAGAGYAIRDWQCDAAYSKALEKAAKQQREMQATINNISAQYETARDATNEQSTIRTNTIREIYRTAPVPNSSCAAPPSVVGLLQGGVDSANAAATGKSSK